MTAEIAVINKSAVALAADSAVTISRGDKNEKTYNVNKLFTLSRYHPVGVMVFDNAELMGVPWETVIKLYRQQLGQKSFSTIDDYASDFIKYIGSPSSLFSVPAQRDIFGEMLIAAFVRIRGDAKSKVKAATVNGKDISEPEIRKIYQAAINDRYEWVFNFEPMDGIPASLRKSIATGYASTVNAAIKGVFDKIKLPRKSISQLKSFAIEMHIRGMSPFGQTGVVIAGFGEDQIYPAVKTFSASAVFKNKLLFRNDDDRSHSPRKELGNGSILKAYAAVIPFAQTDVVSTFVNGVDPQFLRVVYQQINDLLGKYPALLAEKAGITNNDEVEALRQTLQEHNNQALEHIQKEFNKRIRETHQQPLLEIVAALPKDELANIASALVELTSIKRKMSRGLETVGGPIDVAVISKGDGFVWISRKHYFRPELNVRFSSNYFRELVNEQGTIENNKNKKYE